MKLTERFFIAVMAIFLLFISILLFILALPLIPIEMFTAVLANYFGSLWLIVPSAVLILLAVYILVKGLQSSPNQRFVSLKQSTGNINISIAAVENMVRNIMTQWENINLNRIKIKNMPEGMTVIINITGSPEKVFPELAEGVQKSIKESLEVMTGIPVVEVKVVIDNIAA